MSSLVINTAKVLGKIKPMNAVNNGPVKPARSFSKHGNFEDYKAAGIPFARNHDASFFAYYGGERTVDINAIFRDFDADPYAPESYDFACTDEYILVTAKQLSILREDIIIHRINEHFY